MVTNLGSCFHQRAVASCDISQTGLCTKSCSTEPSEIKTTARHATLLQPQEHPKKQAQEGQVPTSAPCPSNICRLQLLGKRAEGLRRFLSARSGDSSLTAWIQNDSNLCESPGHVRCSARLRKLRSYPEAAGIAKEGCRDDHKLQQAAEVLLSAYNPWHLVVVPLRRPRKLGERSPVLDLQVRSSAFCIGLSAKFRTVCCPSGPCPSSRHFGPFRRRS